MASLGEESPSVANLTMNVNTAVVRYIVGMTDYDTLLALSFKRERAASARLAAQSGMDAAGALHATLTAAAGTLGLPHLLNERRALLDRAARRDADRAAAKAGVLAARAARHAGPTTPWRGWFDGSAHPNPGRCGIGGLLLGPAGQRIEISEPAGYGNSSEAEYRALIAVLRAALDAAAAGITVYGDSQVVIDDVNGAGSALLAEPRAVARALIAQLGGVTLRWIPRHKNPEADALSQRAARPAAGEQTLVR